MSRYPFIIIQGFSKRPIDIQLFEFIVIYKYANCDFSSFKFNNYNYLTSFKLFDILCIMIK